MNLLRILPVFVAAGGVLASSFSARQLPDKIWIGDGVMSRGTYNGQNEGPFLQALSQMTASGAGWQVEVLPGDYRFGQTVTVQLPGARFYGSRAAVIGPGAGLGGAPVLEVDPGATGFALDGLTFEETRSTAGDLILIHAADTAVRGCAFRVQPSAAGGTGNLLHLDGASASIRGALVLGSSFLFDASSAGRVGLRARRCDELRVLANEFRPRSGPGPGALRAAIELDESPDATVRANTFTALESTAGGSEDAILVCKGVAATPGGRLALSANVFGDVTGTSIVAFDGVDSCTVQGNVFGRKSVTNAVVRLIGGEGNAITGNQFHDAGIQGGTCVHAVSNKALIVTANTFLDCQDSQVLLDGVDGANVFGNRFSGSLVTLPGMPPIEVLAGCTDVVVGANAARSANWTQVYTGTATPFLNLP